jgi:LysM repeat protein
MDDRSSRIFVGLCVLVVVWIGVYWMWEPGGADATPRISIADGPVVTTDGDQDDTTDPGTLVEIINAPSVDPVVQEPVVRRETTGAVAPEFRSYTVRKGQTLQDIARIEYGKAAMWSVIARANPRVDPIRLREGMTLRIPVDPGNVQGRDIEDDMDGDGESGAAKQALVIEYVVQPGDSLSKIAQNFYGSSRYTDFVYESNRDVLRSKDAIRVGQTLRLPPLDEGED